MDRSLRRVDLASTHVGTGTDAAWTVLADRNVNPPATRRGSLRLNHVLLAHALKLLVFALEAAVLQCVVYVTY